MKFNKDGSKLISGSKDSTLIIWDLKSNQKIISLTEHKGPINDLAYFP